VTEPNPDAVKRIVAHLWGEDLVNLRAAIESFGNGWTVVPKAAVTFTDDHELCETQVIELVRVLEQVLTSKAFPMLTHVMQDKVRRAIKTRGVTIPR